MTLSGSTVIGNILDPRVLGNVGLLDSEGPSKSAARGYGDPGTQIFGDSGISAIPGDLC